MNGDTECNKYFYFVFRDSRFSFSTPIGKAALEIIVMIFSRSKDLFTIECLRL